MPFLEKEEIKIHYQAWSDGEGPWVTLINGYTRTLVDFRAMAKYLSERGFRVLTFDNRGAGKAECSPVFSIDDIGTDILSLWDHLKIQKSHVLGISYGGTIAIRLSVNAPKRVEKLMLVSVPVNLKYIAMETRAPQRDPRKFQITMLRYFSKRFIARNKILVEGFFRQNLRTFQDPDTALGAQAQRDSMAELDLSDSLSLIQSKTLILHGAEDAIVSPDSAQELKSAIKEASLEILPEVGHLLLAECPLEFYRKAAEFFR